MMFRIIIRSQVFLECRILKVDTQKIYPFFYVSSYEVSFNNWYYFIYFFQITVEFVYSEQAHNEVKINPRSHRYLNNAFLKAYYKFFRTKSGL
jgi:hypothetical protein